MWLEYPGRGAGGKLNGVKNLDRNQPQSLQEVRSAATRRV
jgi:hypothetical protein